VTYPEAAFCAHLLCVFSYLQMHSPRIQQVGRVQAGHSCYVADVMSASLPIFITQVYLATAPIDVKSDGTLREQSSRLIRSIALLFRDSSCCDRGHLVCSRRPADHSSCASCPGKWDQAAGDAFARTVSSVGGTRGVPKVFHEVLNKMLRREAGLCPSVTLARRKLRRWLGCTVRNSAGGG
jgi:hypothetical protein